MVAGPHIPTQAVDILCHCSLDVSVTQKRKAILVPVVVVIVLPSRVLDGLQKVYGAAWPQVYPILDLSVLEPRTAFFLPDSVLMELVKMCIHVIQCSLLHGHGLDLLVLHLAHALDAVFDGVLNRREKCTIRPCGTWSNNRVVVGESIELSVSESWLLTLEVLAHLGAETPIYRLTLSPQSS